MIEVNDLTFEEELFLNNTLPVIVDFWAPWCGPCISIAPIFQKLAKEYEGKVKLVKVNIDETTLASRYGVRSIPTFIAFKGRTVHDVLIGAVRKSKLVEFIDNVIE